MVMIGRKPPAGTLLGMNKAPLLRNKVKKRKFNAFFSFKWQKWPMSEGLYLYILIVVTCCKFCTTWLFYFLCYKVSFSQSQKAVFYLGKSSSFLWTWVILGVKFEFQRSFLTIAKSKQFFRLNFPARSNTATPPPPPLPVTRQKMRCYG